MTTNIVLSEMEARALACLVEKELTTPDYYPLTLHALTAACNQKSNRNPLMRLDAKDVVRALDSLRARNLAWEVTTTGSRVPKYKHGIREAIPLTPQQLAVLCELLLRGPQTPGELRIRAARLAEFTGADQTLSVLHELMQREGGALAAKVPRVTGQREERYAHLLCGPLAAAEEGAAPPPEPARVAVMTENERFAKIEAETAALREEIAKLKAQLEELAGQFR